MNLPTGTLAVLAACLLASSPARAVTLKIATVLPDGTSWMREMRQAAEVVEERTEGRVKLKFYPGGVMGTEKAVMRKMRVGQLQGGAFTPTGLADLYRDAEIYGLPFLFHSYEEVDYVRARMDERIRAGLKEAGLIVLAIGETGFAYLLSNKPIRRVEDLPGAERLYRLFLEPETAPERRLNALLNLAGLELARGRWVATRNLLAEAGKADVPIATVVQIPDCTPGCCQRYELCGASLLNETPICCLSQKSDTKIARN